MVPRGFLKMISHKELKYGISLKDRVEKTIEKNGN